jgi:hypothetical protein
MRMTVRIVFCCMISLMMMTSALAFTRPTKQKANVTGVYENFTVGQGSGDLEGMRVVIVSAGGGHHAIVQIAQGGAEDPQPVFVEVKVKGMNVEFAVGEMKFTGTVTAAGLRLKNADGTTMLKRRACSSYM